MHVRNEIVFCFLVQVPIYNFAKEKTIYFDVTKTCLYKFYPLKSHFYVVKLGFTEVYIIFLISAQKHRLWVLAM